MAAQTITTKIAVTMKLNDGTTESGNPRTVNVGIGTLDKDAFDAEKVLSVVGYIVPCLTKTLNTVQKTETSTITAAS